MKDNNNFSDCNLCGKKVSQLFSCRIEDSVIMVCYDCTEYGAIIKTPKVNSYSSNLSRDILAPVESVVYDYSSRIKRARENKNLSIEILANKLKEKESVMHRIEQGKFVPPIEFVRKIERVLGIKLIDEKMDSGEETEIKNKSGALTLGDLLSEKLKDKKIFKD